MAARTAVELAEALPLRERGLMRMSCYIVREPPPVFDAAELAMV